MYNLLLAFHSQDEQFKMAANCFKAADSIGYFEWAQGQYEMETGQKEMGKECFRRSALAFFEKGEYAHTLDLLLKVMEQPPWNEEDNHIYDTSRAQLPTHFPRAKAIQFALHRNRLNEITIDDLKDGSSAASLFIPFRQNIDLKNLISAIVSSCSDHDLAEVEDSLPLLLADWYFGNKKYFRAAKLYLERINNPEQDFAKAEEATNLMIRSSTSGENFHTIAQYWAMSKGKEASRTMVNTGGDACLLLQVYENPVDVAKRGRSTDAYRKFGADVIRWAFKQSKSPVEVSLMRYLTVLLSVWLSLLCHPQTSGASQFQH